jgi:hypothetical protein
MSQEDKDKTPGDRPDIRKEGMHTEDKVLIGILVVAALGLLLLARWVVTSLFGVAVGASAGIGFRDAFIAALVISFLVITIFAVVAGDGALGELTAMIVGFFIMVIFFTLSIAIIL